MNPGETLLFCAERQTNAWSMPGEFSTCSIALW
jgi:hypothetical protein